MTTKLRVGTKVDNWLTMGLRNVRVLKTLSGLMKVRSCDTVVTYIELLLAGCVDVRNELDHFLGQEGIGGHFLKICTRYLTLLLTEKIHLDMIYRSHPQEIPINEFQQEKLKKRKIMVPIISFNKKQMKTKYKL